MNSNHFYFSSIFRDEAPSSKCYHVVISNRLEVLKNSILSDKGKGQFDRVAGNLPLHPAAVLIREVRDESEARKDDREKKETSYSSGNDERFALISLASLWNLLYNDTGNAWELLGEKFGSLADLWQKAIEKWAQTNRVNASEAPKVTLELGERIEKDITHNIVELHQNLLVLSCYGHAASLERQKEKVLPPAFEKLEFHQVNINLKMASTRNARRSQMTHLQARVEGRTFGLNFDNSGISMPLPSFLNLMNSQGIRKIMKDAKTRAGQGSLASEENYRDIVVATQAPAAKGQERNPKRPKLDTKNPFVQLMMRGMESHQVKKLINNPPTTDAGAEAGDGLQCLENEGDVQGASGGSTDDYDLSQYF